MQQLSSAFGVSFPLQRSQYELLDLASQQSVWEFAQRLLDLPKLDLLFNNAGVMRLSLADLIRFESPLSQQKVFTLERHCDQLWQVLASHEPS